MTKLLKALTELSAVAAIGAVTDSEGDRMRQVARLFTLLAMLAFGSIQSANASPYEGFPSLPEGAAEIGRGNIATTQFAYVAATGELSQHANIYAPLFYPGGGLVPGLLGGYFDWTARLNPEGEVDGLGSASLVLDFGMGLKTYATGEVVDFGFGLGGCHPPTGTCSYALPSVSIRLTSVNEAISSWAGTWWQWIGFMSVLSEGPFHEHDYSCGTPTAPCAHFSHDDLVFYRVPEPATLALIGVALAGLGLSRRKQANV